MMECVNPYLQKKEKEVSPRDMPQQKEVGEFDIAN